ncbi:hypothetical protein MRB53_040782 [Persea americana]|nr:hypothetical protein MRB53_040782 [Persea americana]
MAAAKECRGDAFVTGFDAVLRVSGDVMIVVHFGGGGQLDVGLYEQLEPVPTLFQWRQTGVVGGLASLGSDENARMWMDVMAWEQKQLILPRGWRRSRAVSKSSRVIAGSARDTASSVERRSPLATNSGSCPCCDPSVKGEIETLILSVASASRPHQHPRPRIASGIVAAAYVQNGPLTQTRIDDRCHHAILATAIDPSAYLQSTFSDLFADFPPSARDASATRGDDDAAVTPTPTPPNDSLAGHKRKSAPHASGVKPCKKVKRVGPRAEFRSSSTTTTTSRADGMPDHDGDKDTEAGGGAAKPKRVRTGCLTCRERHLKCDEALPWCNNCRKSSRECKRGVRLNFIDIWAEAPPTSVSQFGTRNWQVTFLDESREIASEYQGGIEKYRHLERQTQGQQPHGQPPGLPPGQPPGQPPGLPQGQLPQEQPQEQPQGQQPTAASFFAFPPDVSHNITAPMGPRPLPTVHNILPDTSAVATVDVPFHISPFDPQAMRDGNPHASVASRPQPRSGSTQLSSGIASTASLAPGSVASYSSLDNDLPDEPEHREFLRNQDETLYMQVFVEEVGLWMDSMDPHKHFSRLLPFHSLSEPMLLNAFLACGARHLVLVNPSYSEEKALHYYDTATRYLLKNLQNPDRDTVICATTAVILNVYEIMSERALQRMNHIAGARALIKECGWNARAQGIGSACFWLNVGLEVLSCLHFNWQVAWDPDDWGLDLNLAREVLNGREEIWTQRMLYIIAKVCNYRATAPKGTDPMSRHDQRRLQQRHEEWTRLKAWCEAWNSGIPRTMHPMAFLYPRETRNRSCFPEVWLVKRTTTVARLFFHTAMLLLAQVHPYLHAETTDMADMISQHAQMICGIVAHLKDRGVASVAIRSLAHAAEVLTDRKEQEEVISIFERINRETGWRIGFVYKELKEKWAWKEGPSLHHLAQTHAAASEARSASLSSRRNGSVASITRHASSHAPGAATHDPLASLATPFPQPPQQQQQQPTFPPTNTAPSHRPLSVSSSSTTSSPSLRHHQQYPQPPQPQPFRRQSSLSHPPPAGLRNPMYAKADFSLPHHPYQNFYVAPSSTPSASHFGLSLVAGIPQAEDMGLSADMNAAELAGGKSRAVCPRCAIYLPPSHTMCNPTYTETQKYVVRTEILKHQERIVLCHGCCVGEASVYVDVVMIYRTEAPPPPPPLERRASMDITRQLRPHCLRANNAPTSPYFNYRINMVLEEATSSNPDARPYSSRANAGFLESQPPSDADPYAASTDGATDASTAASVRGDTASIALAVQRVPDLYRFRENTSAGRGIAKSTTDSSRLAAQILHRPMRQEEMDAVAFHLSKGLTYERYGTATGAALGIAQWYRHRLTYRFPGYAVGEKFNPDKFGPIRGNPARLAWQGLRFNAYLLVGAVVGSVFLGSYGVTLAMVGRAQDPRLRDFNEQLRARAESIRRAGNTGMPSEVDQSPGQRSGETYEMARQRQTVAERWGRRSDTAAGQPPQQQQYDDMSPTGGSFKDEIWGSSQTFDSELMSDSQLAQQQTRADRHSPRSTPPTSPSSATHNAPSSTSSPSPTPSQTAPQSAWARLRQKATSNTPSPSPSPSNQQEPLGLLSSSSSSSSSPPFPPQNNPSTEDPLAARAQAQADFDARIEREREGGDFSSGSAREGAGGRGRATVFKSIKSLAPLLDRVLVQRVKAEAKTAGGLFLPETAVKELNEARVLAVGPGLLDKDGKRMPMGVSAGDRVLIPQVGEFVMVFGGGRGGDEGGERRWEVRGGGIGVLQERWKGLGYRLLA